MKKNDNRVLNILKIKNKRMAKESKIWNLALPFEESTPLFSIMLFLKLYFFLSQFFKII